VSPPLRWNRRAVDLFWRFVRERHEIFIRRVVEKQPPPWTRDPALAGGHYCNVYRILDRVTRDLIHSVLVPSQGDPPTDRLFNILLYRAFNLPEVYTALGGYRRMVDWDLTQAQHTLLTRQQAGGKIFTGAFMVNGRGEPEWRGPGGKVRLWVERLKGYQQGMKLLWERLDLAGPGTDEHRALMTLSGVGSFLAYQVWLDCTYEPQPLLPRTRDAWADVGPGAVKGLRFLIHDNGYRDWPEALWKLRHQQALRGVVRPRGPELTLADVENCLCEYSKYVRLRQGIHPKRTYKPSGESADLTPWADVPETYWTA